MTAIQFNTLIKDEAKSLRKYAYQLTRDIEDTNDLVQETMLKAIVYFDKFEEGTNLRGWLYTIMKNTFINNYRRMVKRNTFIDQSGNDFYLNSAQLMVRNDGERKFMLRDIEKAIENLPANLGKPFSMNYKGFKYQEIADILNIPIGTVKTRIFMAKRLLRQQLKGYAKIYGLDNIQTEEAA